MEPDVVASVLADRAGVLRESLAERWGDAPHRVRDPIHVPEYGFPSTPDDIFPWVAVCFVVEDGRVLLVQDSGHSSEWEPPGGKGETLRISETASGGYREQDESVAQTAERETREETGIDCEVTELLFTETLRFDYGEAVLVPVLQAGFVARRCGGRLETTEDVIENAGWFPTDELPEGTQFEDEVRSISTPE